MATGFRIDSAARIGYPRSTSLTAEIGNLRTAWRFWVDQGDLEQVFNLIDGLWALHEAKGWYHAAIELASDALGVLAKAEPSPELAAEELILRTSMARALMAVRGYGPEVEEEFKRALEISQIRRHSGATLPGAPGPRHLLHEHRRLRPGRRVRSTASRAR